MPERKTNGILSLNVKKLLILHLVITRKGSNSLSQMQTPPYLILLEWSARNKLYSSILSKLSGVEEAWYLPDKLMKSCLSIEIYAFNCVNFEKLRADKLLILKWLREREV